MWASPLPPPHTQYLVKRVGCSLTEYGKVDCRAAKRQRCAGPEEEEGESAACPVSLQQVEEWEAYLRRFKGSIHEHTIDNELDLGAWGGSGIGRHGACWSLTHPLFALIILGLSSVACC